MSWQVYSALLARGTSIPSLRKPRIICFCCGTSSESNRSATGDERFLRFQKHWFQKRSYLYTLWTGHERKSPVPTGVKQRIKGSTPTLWSERPNNPHAVFNPTHNCTIFFPEKVHEEIDQSHGQNWSSCVVDWNQLPHTDAMIHEIQRFIVFLEWSGTGISGGILFPR